MPPRLLFRGSSTFDPLKGSDLYFASPLPHVAASYGGDVGGKSLIGMYRAHPKQLYAAPEGMPVNYELPNPLSGRPFYGARNSFLDRLAVNNRGPVDLMDYLWGDNPVHETLISRRRNPFLGWGLWDPKREMMSRLRLPEIASAQKLLIPSTENMW